jgi:rod shape determining protein RodA
MNNSLLYRLDWISLLIYLLLVGFGLLNIYSSTFQEFGLAFSDLSANSGKQFWIFIACLFVMPIVLYLKSNLFEHFSYLFYALSIVGLIGLFIFGQKIAGATSWYSIGGFGLQPAEFAKITTALVLSEFLSGIQKDISKRNDFLKVLFFILLPVFLILLQPDAGSALVFFALFFVLFREGLHLKWLFLALGILAVFLATLLFKPLIVCAACVFILFTALLLGRKRRRKINPLLYIIMGVSCIAFSYSVDFIFNSVFEQRHRDRFNIILGLETDTRGIGYNINQSKIAIGSGGFSGKGFLNGTQTKGGFVPEQHTDYIFSTIGEEWGFLGSSCVILLFTLFIFRIIYRAEKQTSAFRRIYSYAFASILYFHFFINIGMTLGLVPTIGIPLPFISYGGSSLMAFSLMFFIYLNLDSNRLT